MSGHCPPDTWFDIWALVVWGPARYLLDTEVPHNLESLRVSGEETFCFFETWRPDWGSSPRSPTSKQAALPTAPGPSHKFSNEVKRANQDIYDRSTWFIQTYFIALRFNPSSPHDALKHHFTSLKTGLIFLQIRALEWKFPWNWLSNTWQFSSIFKPHQIIFMHYKTRIATAIRGL